MVDKEPARDKSKEFRVVDALKFLYALLNTVGGEKKTATIPKEMFNDMPPDWADRLKFREIAAGGETMYQAYLKPRKRKRNKIVQPKAKKLILPPSLRN